METYSLKTCFSFFLELINDDNRNDKNIVVSSDCILVRPLQKNMSTMEEFVNTFILFAFKHCKFGPVFTLRKNK